MNDLNTIEKIIIALYQLNSNRSLSGVLKFIKRQARFYPFGDYPIISRILHIARQHEIAIKKQKVEYAIRTSSDFNHLKESDKKDIRQQLFMTLYVEKNGGSDQSKKEVNRRNDLLVMDSF